MGSYATTGKLIERMTQTRVDALAKVTGAAQTALLTSVIARAEAVVNGYLRKVYAVPVDANELCEEWTLCIAEYELWKRGSGSDVPKKIRDSWKDTLAQLKDVAKGDMTLPVSSTPASSGGSSIMIESDEPRYDEENSKWL